MVTMRRQALYPVESNGLGLAVSAWVSREGGLACAADSLALIREHPSRLLSRAVSAPDTPGGSLDSAAAAKGGAEVSTL